VGWDYAGGLIAAGAVGAVLGLACALMLAARRTRRTTRSLPARPAEPDGPASPRGTARHDGASGGAPAPADLDSVVRLILDALRVGVLVLDTDDVAVLSNAAAHEMGLVDPGDVDVHPVVRTLAAEVRRTRARRDAEVETRRPAPDAGTGGQLLGLHLRAVALAGGNVAVEATDVTEAHRVARVRRDFVANVSHELKTPVGALQLLAEALHEATELDGGVTRDPAAARRFAERIRHESTRLGRLVNELLALSRLQGAEPLPEPEPVSVDRVIAEVLDRTRTPAAAKQIALRSRGERGLTVFGNESQLATAVCNLVENAIEYSPEATHVVVTTRRADDVIDIAVTDQGIGIEPVDLDRIFERFYRADRARSRATGGTGLGLAIVKHIATNHAGRIEVTSTVGVGSTFTLRLPARGPQPAPPRPPDVDVGSEPVPRAQPAVSRVDPDLG
jgi:two-component system sensor histidine kinase SenX3